MGRPHIMEPEYKYPRIVQETRYVMQGGSTKIVLAVSNIKYGKKIVFSCTVVDMSSTLARETLYEEKRFAPTREIRALLSIPEERSPEARRKAVEILFHRFVITLAMDDQEHWIRRFPQIWAPLEDREASSRETMLEEVHES